ncbi:hypothetical protein D3C72_1791960 [compost metagenome]
MTRQFVEGAGSIGDYEHFETFVQGRQRREGHAHFGDDTGDNQLFATGGFHCLDEVVVIPGIYLPRAWNKGCIGELSFEFRDQRAVGAVFEAGGQNSRQVKILR